jgi:hypothetical protein
MPIVAPPTASMFTSSNPDLASAWTSTAPQPTDAQRAEAEQNRVALKLLPEIFAEDFAASRRPLGGFARMVPKDNVNISSPALIPADEGGYWVPANHIELVSSMLDVAEALPDAGPAETLRLHLERAIGDGRVPAGYSRAQHKTDLNAGISGGAEGPIIKIGLNDWLIPHAMTASAHAAGFEINPRRLR